MRTTVRIDDDLLERAKRLALERRETLTAVFEEALREMLARREEPGGEAPRRVELPSFGGRGPRPGIDLHDSAALAEAMDARDAGV